MGVFRKVVDNGNGLVGQSQAANEGVVTRKLVRFKMCLLPATRFVEPLALLMRGVSHFRTHFSAEAQDSKMTDLKGSPLQIKWAKRIRYSCLQGLEYITNHFTHPDPWTQRRVTLLAVRTIDETDAMFWIAHAHDTYKRMLMDQEFRDLRANLDAEAYIELILSEMEGEECSK